MQINRAGHGQPGRAEDDRIAAKEAPPQKREELIDEAVEETFPASDPPSYMGGAATGGPRQRPVDPSPPTKPRP